MINGFYISNLKKETMGIKALYITEAKVRVQLRKCKSI